jgi:hypothetical protein
MLQHNSSSWDEKMFKSVSGTAGRAKSKLAAIKSDEIAGRSQQVKTHFSTARDKR